jgi:hypothetical protein
MIEPPPQYVPDHRLAAEKGQDPEEHQSGDQLGIIRYGKPYKC